MCGFGRALGAGRSEVLALIFCVALPTDSDKDCDKNELLHRSGDSYVLTFEITGGRRPSGRLNCYALPLHEGWWTERMFCKPLACTFHEKAVKSIIWDGRLDLAHISGRNAKLKKTKGEINQIALSE